MGRRWRNIHHNVFTLASCNRVSDIHLNGEDTPEEFRDRLYKIREHLDKFLVHVDDYVEKEAKRKKEKEKSKMLANEMGAILKKVCEFYGCNIEDVRGKGRAREIVKARYTTAKLINENSSTPLASIGKVLDRDHSTISYYLRVYRDELEVSRKYRNEIEQIKAMI